MGIAKLSGKQLFLGLLVICFLVRVVRLWYPDTYYFDEVYHAFTAEAYAQNDPRGYEWWNSAPQGFAYEWLHPPLAKLIQASSIRLFGDTSFFWRFPGVIFGTGVGILLYLFGKNVFKSERLGLLALFLLSFDGLALTSSRITMNDTYLAFWVLLTFYLFLTNRSVWLVGIALGLSVATKWTGAYALGMVALLWFSRQAGQGLSFKKLVGGAVAFGVLPLLVYLLSYSQFFLQGHTLDQFKELHQQTWWYQTNLTATHPYSSSPAQWALDLRPLYAFTQGYGDKVANIYLMGNPWIRWGGVAAVVFIFVYLAIKKIKRGFSKGELALAVVLFGYLGMFVPWVFSPRVMFVYHYVPALPFLFLLLAWLLEKIWKFNRMAVIGYLTLVFVSFVYFYPHWTGIPVPVGWDGQYYWFTSWR